MRICFTSFAFLLVCSITDAQPFDALVGYDRAIYFRTNALPGESTELGVYRPGDAKASVVVINLGEGFSAPGEFVPTNDALYFFAQSAATGRELWRYTTEQGATPIEFESGPNGNSGSVQVIDGTLYFSARTSDGKAHLVRFEPVTQQLTTLHSAPEEAYSTAFERSRLGNDLFFIGEAQSLQIVDLPSGVVRMALADTFRVGSLRLERDTLFVQSALPRFSGNRSWFFYDAPNRRLAPGSPRQLRGTIDLGTVENTRYFHSDTAGFPYLYASPSPTALRNVTDGHLIGSKRHENALYVALAVGRQPPASNVFFPLYRLSGETVDQTVAAETGFLDVREIGPSLGAELYVYGRSERNQGFSLFAVSGLTARPIEAIVTSTERVPAASTADLKLIGAQPIRTTATFRLKLPAPIMLRARLVDALGRTVAAQPARMVQPGETIFFDVSRLPAGVYFAAVQGEGMSLSANVVVVR